MKTPHLLISLFLFLVSTVLNGQAIFLEEGFENNGSIPTGWSQEISTGTASWDFVNGGAFGGGGSGPYPESAHSGDYNARFFKSSYFNHETYLISPVFSFEFAQKPELKFWYSQYEDQLPDLEPDNNSFKIYYRSPEEGNHWFLLKELSDPTEGWVFDSLPIPDSITNKKYKQVQLGFLGVSSTQGFGSCIDDLLLIETDTVTKYIEKIYASQPNQDIIPSGSINNPILRLRFPVQGNDGELILDSVVITGMEKASEVVASGGVKLFHTTSEYFTSTHQIAAGVSFEENKAIFTDINFSLPYGNSFIWVSYDVPEDTQHEFKDIKVDAKVESYNIKVNDAYFPLSELNPNGYRKINESLFFDDFETDKGWTLSGEFEIDTTYGLGGSVQNPDPDYAKSGVKILGTDVSGLGSKPGDYEPGLVSNEYQAITPTFDCTYYKDLNIQFYRWLNVNFGDTASIDYSLDGGVSWQRAWINDALIAEREWQFQQLSLSNVLDRSPSVTLRFSLGPTGVSHNLSGWNIDNFAFTGTNVNSDIGISELIAPSGGCGHVGPEPLKVVVKNYGFDETDEPLPLKYSLNNGTSWVHDTLLSPISQNDTSHFTFSQLLDITAPGYHHLQISTNLESDEDNRNNLLDTIIFVTPTYSLPYFEDFEANYGYYKNGGKNESWTHGVPTGTKISGAYSGTKCWATQLSGNYVNNDSSWMESPCFDFTGMDKPILDFMLQSHGEPDKDGLAVYYSLNEGISWNLVPSEGSFYWNWYNNTTIEALGHEGWDSLTSTWFKARQILPNELANQNNVKFRFLFTSNDTITAEGFAIDDIRLYNAPIDAGVSALIAPVNACYLSESEQVTVALKNYGVRSIPVSDPILTTLIINNTTLTDTFYVSTPLAVNDTAHFTFGQSANMSQKKWHRIEAYTTIPGDTAYYTAGIFNDTLRDSVFVKGEPLYGIGPNIGTTQSDTINLDGGVHSMGGTDFMHYTWKYEQKPDSTPIADTRFFGVPAFPVGQTYMDFTLTIENDSGCFAYDTIQIIKSQVDIGVSAISGISNSCIDNQNQLLEVEVTNFTTGYVMPQDTLIKVGYKTNESEFATEVIESFVLPADLNPGETISHIFAQQPHFSLDGTYTLSAFTVIYVDLDYSNDTLSSGLTIYPLPDVELGPDSVLTLQADTLMLDAGAGFNSYVWSDASIGQSLALSSNLTQRYAVTVSDVNACGSDSDSVLIIADNWVLDTILNPTNQCEPSASEQISIVLKNSGNNTYPSGYSIPSTLVFNGTSYPENLVLPANLAPADSITYTFSPSFDMSAIGSYDISVTLNPQHDMLRSDNYLSQEVAIWGVKQVELGADTIITQRADTILLDAGDQFESYLWQDNSTASTLQISDQSSTSYWVSVTDFNGCPTSTDMVRIIAHNLALEELVSPEPKCDIEGINSIIFTLRNSGPDIIHQGEVIEIGYFIDAASPTITNYQFPFDLYPDQTKQVTLNEAFTFEPGIHYDFTVFIDWEKDYFKENDTLKSVVFQLDHPTVNMGDDIYTLQADTVVLHAPKGYSTYYWQNSSRADSLAVTKKYGAEYWVQIRNAYGCTDADSLMIYTYDLAIASLESLNNCEVSSETLLSMNIQLNSADTLYAGDEIQASYTFMGTTVNETLTLADVFTSSAPLAYTFATPFVLSDTGNYSISAAVAMEHEVLESNNAITSTFRIGAYPVHLGEDIVSYDGVVMLDAGPDFASYLWSDSSTNSTLEVTVSGTYAVTTTDVNMCTASDSLQVLFMNPGYEIIAIKGLRDSCAHATDEKISFTLENTGNDTLMSGSVASISYQLNEETEIQESYTFLTNFTPGALLDIDFSTPADLSEALAYQIKVTATVAGKFTTLDTIVQTWPLPEVDLGEDMESANENEVLDAGADFTTYLWNTGATTQTITVSENGEYVVTVTNAMGCAQSDGIQVYFLPVKLSIHNFIRPLLACGEITNEEVTISVKNTGSKPIPAGTTLTLAYQLEDENRVEASTTLGNVMNPNLTLEFSFPEKLSTAKTGTLQIDFFVGVEDMDLDTAAFEIPVYEKPSFFNGIDSLEVETFPYLLDPMVTAESYLWNTDETSSTITIQSDGSYSVTITQANTCAFADTIVVKKITAISDSWSQHISVYPNPGEKEVFIDLPEDMGKVSLQITDINGKLIHTAKDVSEDVLLDIQWWQPGIYILRIFNNRAMGVYQMVKK